MQKQWCWLTQDCCSLVLYSREELDQIEWDLLFSLNHHLSIKLTFLCLYFTCTDWTSQLLCVEVLTHPLFFVNVDGFDMICTYFNFSGLSHSDTEFKKTSYILGFTVVAVVAWTRVRAPRPLFMFRSGSAGSNQRLRVCCQLSREAE